jgi:hypothetical protein
MSQDKQSPGRTRSRKLQGPRLASAVAGVGLAGLIVGAAVAQIAGHSNPAVGKPDAALKGLLQFGSPPKQLVAVFAVALDGTVQPYYLAQTGKPAQWEDIPNPLAEFDLNVKIGNPKVCWTTSGGGQECVVY